jgi:hypothetical protein
MGKPDDPRELLSDTMKELFPPRVDLVPRQYELLLKHSKRTGKSVKDIVRRAIDQYLREDDPK